MGKNKNFVCVCVKNGERIRRVQAYHVVNGKNTHANRRKNIFSEDKCGHTSKKEVQTCKKEIGVKKSRKKKGCKKEKMLFSLERENLVIIVGISGMGIQSHEQCRKLTFLMKWSKNYR